MVDARDCYIIAGANFFAHRGGLYNGVGSALLVLHYMAMRRPQIEEQAPVSDFHAFFVSALPQESQAAHITIPSRPMRPIGELIKEELKAQERSITWFARKLCIDRSNVYRLFQKNSIDTDLLTRISLVLNKDFFAILTQGLEERRTSQRL